MTEPKTKNLKTLTVTASLVPFAIFNEPPEAPRRFAKDLIAEGWVMLSIRNKNRLVMVDWCKENLHHNDFGVNPYVNALIFRDATVAIQFKLACL
jgi:hypothetical protein